MRIFEHQGGLLRDIPIAANGLFAPIDRYSDLVHPVVLSTEIGIIRRRQDRKIGLARRAEAASRDLVICHASRRINKALTRRGVNRNGRTQTMVNPARICCKFMGCCQVTEIAAQLRRRRYPMGMNPAATLAVPFFRPEEIYFVLLDRTAQGVTEIVAAQHVLAAVGVVRRAAPAQEEVILGVQSVVAAEVVDVAMVLVASALGYDIDLCAGCAPIFGAVTVALDLELLNAVNGRIGKNSALRADIVVRSTIHGPLVVHGGRTAEGNIHTGEQALVLIVEAFADGCARNERRQLHKVPAIYGQFANLLAEHDVRNIASRGIDTDRRGFHHHGFRGRSHLHLQIQSGDVSNVQLNILQCQLLETGFIHCEAVGTCLQLGQGKAAFLVRHRLSSSCRTFVDHADCRARNNGAARVGQCASDRARSLLRRGIGDQNQKANCKTCTDSHSHRTSPERRNIFKRPHGIAPASFLISSKTHDLNPPQIQKGQDPKSIEIMLLY